MKLHIFLTAALCGLFGAACLVADPIVTPTSEPVLPPPAAESPDVPAVKLDKSGQPSEAFLTLHENFLKRGRENPIDLLFIGDSITAGWAWSGKSVWQERYVPLNAANFGIGGDRTQHVLWRIAHGELDGISPKVVVLLIGVNNGGNPAVARGVIKVVNEIHARLPGSKILLLGIFPHGNDPLNPPWIPKARIFTAGVNKELAALDDGKKTRFLDIGNQFLDADGAISKEIMPDGLHPGLKGYQIWAEAMQPLLDEMLGVNK